MTFQTIIVRAYFWVFNSERQVLRFLVSWDWEIASFQLLLKTVQDGMMPKVWDWVVMVILFVLVVRLRVPLLFTWLYFILIVRYLIPFVRYQRCVSWVFNFLPIVQLWECSFVVAKSAIFLFIHWVFTFVLNANCYHLS